MTPTNTATLARHWHTATHPLTRLDKLFVAIMATFPILLIILLTLDPSWGTFFDLLISLGALVMSWRWVWLENVHESLLTAAMVGASVTHGLYEHGEIIVTRNGRKYTIRPAEERRNT